GDKEVHMEMEHVPTADSYVYSGDFFIMINESGYGGNCPDSDVTNNFTVAYEMTSKTSAALQARSAMFCGSDIDGRDANGYVAAGDKYSDENPDGWGNDYNLLTANFDPTTLDGNYSYAWQAGHFDNNTRVFNIIVTDEGTQGTSFYGYGDDIAATDGSIDGFICNWVAPGADHTMLEYVQQQDMSVDLETGLVSAEASFITYAPTTTCEYDGTGAFVFDTNIDDDLSDEDAALVITTDAGTMDLVPGADENGDSEATVEEVIEASGFTLPAM
ncbi:MAG TPA: hypothetical protein VJC18_08470, partial [bacterium]|nr:hypothetical protein [bacterium]